VSISICNTKKGGLQILISKIVELQIQRDEKNVEKNDDLINLPLYLADCFKGFFRHDNTDAEIQQNGFV